MRLFLTAAGVAAAAFVVAGQGQAQLAVSANDGKAVLINGGNEVPKTPTADTVAVIDLSQSPPKLVAEIEVPASVVGSLLSVAITPDEAAGIRTAQKPM